MPRSKLEALIKKVTVNAADALAAVVKGFGRVNYIGTPKLSPVLRGGGSIRAVEDEANVCLPDAV